MGLKIIWTKQANEGFENILNYLESNFSEKEIRKFVKDTLHIVSLIKDFPEILPKTSHHKNLRRGPINKQSLITYRILPKKGTIEIINISSARRNR